MFVNPGTAFKKNLVGGVIQTVIRPGYEAVSLQY